MDSPLMSSWEKVREARDEFDELLKRERTLESDWQALFARVPDLLALSLPLRVDPRQIEALGRPWQSEPDFIIHPEATRWGSPRGIIELKKPSQPVLRQHRKDVIRLSSEASGAVAQAKTYAAKTQWPRAVFLGNDLHMFVIMGLSKEWADLLQCGLVHSLIRDQLQGVALLGFDQLLSNLSASIPPKAILLVPNATRPLFDPAVFDPAIFNTEVDDPGELGEPVPASQRIVEDDPDINSLESIADLMFQGDMDAAQHWLEKDRD